MSPDDDAPTSEAEFEEALGTLLRNAGDEGVDVEGGWDCRNGPDHPDWDVIISRVRKSEASE